MSESLRTGWLPGGLRGAPLAVAALGLTLLALNLGVFGLLRLLTSNQERYLGEYLQLVGRTITEPPRDFFWVLEVVADPATGEVYEDAYQTYRDSLDWRNLEDSLSGALREGLIREASLVTRAGYVLIASSFEEEPELLPLEQLEAEELTAVEDAWTGGMATPPETRSQPPERLYVPLRNEIGEVLAVVRLDVHPDSYAAFRDFRNRLLFGFLAGSGLLIALWAVTARVIHRSVQAERAASQADRLRALGTLTAGLAHEIRNPLGIIQLQLEELGEAFERAEDPEARRLIAEGLDGLRDEARRIGNLTRSFLQFSRRESGAGEQSGTEELDAGEAVGTLTRMWMKGLDPDRRKVEIRQPAAGSHRARFPHDRLTQILLNLLRNADEALGEREGRIEVTVTRAGGNVEIVVSDNGPGMDAPTLRRVFDPFFTTRAEGTGLGLSLARTYAEAHGGSLEVESAPGRGAAFILRIPGAG